MGRHSIHAHLEPLAASSFAPNYQTSADQSAARNPARNLPGRQETRLAALSVDESGMPSRDGAPASGALNTPTPDTGTSHPAGNNSDGISSGDMPLAWHVTGAQAANCKIQADHDYVQGGSASALLRSSNSDSSQHCGIIQASRIGEFRGKRLAFSAYLATSAVSGGAALWFRAEAADGTVLAFENQLLSSPVTADSPWTIKAIVIDVPASVEGMFYGASLAGGGELWMDSAEFDIVDNSVPVSGHSAHPQAKSRNMPIDLRRLLPMPVNLDFEQTVPIQP